MRSIVSLLPKLGKRSLSRVFTAMIVSNLILLLIPVSMGLFLYTKVEDVLEGNARRQNTAMLEQLRLSLDNKLKEMDILAKQLAFNPKLATLLSYSGTPEDEAYKQVEFVRNDLNRYQSFASGFVKDFYVYLQANDLILKPGVRTDTETFYNKYYQYENASYHEWQEVLGSYHNLSFQPSAALWQDPVNLGNKARVITFVQSLPIYEVTETRGSLVILIDEAKIQEMFKQLELANDSTIFIVDQAERIIASTDQDTSLGEGLLQRLTRASGLFHDQWNGTDSIISYTSSKQADWYYVSIMPKDLFMQKVESMKHIALLVLIVALVCGGAAACWIAYRQYSPVKRMVAAIIQGRPSARVKAGNEYDFITASIEGTLLEERHLRSRLMEQAPVIQTNFLSRLIRGYVDLEQESMDAQLDFMNIQFISDTFAVFIVQIEDIAEYAQVESEAKWTQVRFIISNIALDLMNERHVGYAVELERDRIAFLLNMETERADRHAEELHVMQEQLLQIMQDRFKVCMTIAVSDMHEGTAEIGHAYLEAMAAFDYRMFRGQNAIIHFGELQETTPHYYYPLEFEVQLVNHVKSGDIDNVAKLLDNIYEMNFNTAKMTLELGLCLFFNIISTFLKITNTTNSQLEPLLGPNADPIKNLFNCKTVDEMHKETKRLYAQLTASFRTSQSDHSKQLLMDITEMIDLHLRDQNLGLVMIADHFGMTPQYVSSFFKKASGQNLTDYITRARIELAKQSMMLSEYTNAQLAHMVGYTNDVVFIRAFKKLEGVTPGKYRVSIQRASREQNKEARG